MTQLEHRIYNDKFMLRLPDGMREQIKDAASANNRSMNSEVVHALSLYLATKTEGAAQEEAAASSAVESAVFELTKKFAAELRQLMYRQQLAMGEMVHQPAGRAAAQAKRDKP